jgi:DNA-binding NtrC family response regulator
VRELEHAVERAVLLSAQKEIDAVDLALSREADLPLVLDRLTLPDAEAMLVRNAMERYDNNLQRAAEALGISRQALYRRLEKQRSKNHFEQAH